jgi:hypothetical protein
MPVSRTSRYVGLPVYRAADADGQSHATIPLRPSPNGAAPTGRYEHIITAPETLEYLAWRYYGVSEFWWRIADANPRIFPLDAATGAAVNVPTLGTSTVMVRERSFGS